MKKELEKVYDCLGFSCDDVGGLVVEGTSAYIGGMEPCGGGGGGGLSDGEVAAISIVAIAVVAIIGFCVFRSRRKNKGVNHSAGDVGLGGFGNKGPTSTL